jgi:predicted rRNA methylase YqxC with S4 and FtsJ domains
MKRLAKQRLDQLLVERRLVESRERAKAQILAGRVLVNGQRAAKAGHSFPLDSRIEIVEKLPYVSRGGRKLEAAIEAFHIEVSGKVCLDVGASTGGLGRPPRLCTGRGKRTTGLEVTERRPGDRPRRHQRTSASL